MRKIVSIFIVIFILSACGSGSGRKLNVDVSGINIPCFTIERYEKDLFAIDRNHFLEGIKAIQHKYEVFLGGKELTKNNTVPLFNYISDTSLIRVNRDIQEQYKNIDFLTKELKKAFQYYLHYFPEAKVPEVYTYLSGFLFEQPIQISEQAMIIGLDLYLGENYPDYKKYGIPAYKSRRMVGEQISADCMKELSLLFLDHNFAPKNFLDEIIQNAKSLYFIDAMLPEKADHLKIGFTEKQLQWCTQNERNIWGFFIDKQILYSANYELTRKFINDGPFTHAFSKDAPAGIGNWVGWQIIRAYMDNNPEISLQELLKENDAQKILKTSGYKPKQN